jgi:FkbM family methyltransferase
MKQVRGFWLPDSETHLVPFLENGPMFAGGPTYQAHKWQKALTLFEGRRHFVDVGAHCGLWSRPLASVFAKVTAFEPLQAHRDCFVKNVALPHVSLEPYALGDKPGYVSMDSVPDSTGDSSVSRPGKPPEDCVHFAELATLDSFDLRDVDFLKIDCEGYEAFVIRGGEETIRRDRPCIIVEQKKQHANKYGEEPMAAVKLLQGWGANVAFEIAGDYCLTW